MDDTITPEQAKKFKNQIKKTVGAEKFRMKHKIKIQVATKKGRDYGSACSKNR